MNLRRHALVALIALVTLGSASLLPIDPEQVRKHTIERLTRLALGSLAGSPQPRRVALVIRAVETDAALVRRVVDRLTAYTLLSETQTPLNPAQRLEIAVEVRDGWAQVGGTLGDQTFKRRGRLGDWAALVTPLVALIIALAYRQVIVALFVAIWAGVCVVGRTDPLRGLWEMLTTYLWSVVNNTFNLEILGFAFALVGLVTVVSRMGGTRGLVELVSGLARGPRSTQVLTGLMGTIVFFDDYANTVVVGNTARALTDARRISREKLAYLVDSTSAPIAGVAVISTWIGYEIGLFDSLLGDLTGVPGLARSGYGLFLDVLPLRFYCFFALAMVFVTSSLGRDFGPMLRAEQRARSGGPIAPDSEDGPAASLEKPGAPLRWYNAAIPVGTVLAGVLIGIIVVGRSSALPAASASEGAGLSLSALQAVFSAAGHQIGSILFWSSVTGSVVAILLACGQRILTPAEALRAYAGGLRTLVQAALILILAWAIKQICDDLGTGLALVALLGAYLPAIAVPIAVFLLSGVVAFSTGTSWGTMALMLPVAAPLAVALSGDPIIVATCLGAVLDGAIWGDHCSPISDTTVLSSTSSGCAHVAHVRTQLPYAVLAMAAAAGPGYLGYALGLPLWSVYGLGLGLIVAFVWIIGRSPEPAPHRPPPTLASKGPP